MAYKSIVEVRDAMHSCRGVLLDDFEGVLLREPDEPHDNGRGTRVSRATRWLYKQLWEDAIEGQRPVPYSAKSRMTKEILKRGLSGYTEIREFSRKYVEENALPGAVEMVGFLKGMGKHVICFSEAMSTASHLARDHFGISDLWSNVADYDCDDCLVRIGSEFGRDGAEGRGLLEKIRHMLRSWYRLDMGDCVSIGRDKNSIHLMDRSRLSLASPASTEEARKRADFFVEDYQQFLEGLKASV